MFEDHLQKLREVDGKSNSFENLNNYDIVTSIFVAQKLKLREISLGGTEFCLGSR
jgi:hypothetical protein